jgi:tricorn protease
LSLKVDFADRVYLLPLAKDTRNPLIPGNDLEPVPGQAPEGQAPAGPVKVKVDLDGIENRLIALPVPTGNIGYIAGANEGVYYFIATQGKQEDALSKFDLRARRSSPFLATAPDQFAFNGNRTKMVTFVGGREPVMSILDGPATQPGAERRVTLSGVQAMVDPRAEWKQIYWDAWRFERDRFYDPQMLGMNWKAMGDHYAQYLPYVTHRSDLSYVLGLLIGELGTSHAYVNAPPADPEEGAKTPQVSGLGAEYEVAGNNIRFAKVYTGRSFEETLRAPLAEAGVNVKAGDYLLEIDGQAVTATTHPHMFLTNKAGQIVTLTVNDKPSLDGARKVLVRPTDSEGPLRFLDWYEETRRKVDQMSGGRIGYIYLPNTGNAGQVEFIRGFYSQTDKDAVIVDERWNGGGNVQPFIVPTLQRIPFATIRTRASEDSPDMAAIPGPKVMLINAYAGSGGDYTPWMFRRAKLGPLIGERTWGGLVGIQGYYTLMDGGQVSAPSFGFHDPETGEWIAENKGVAPDIAVDDRPDLIAKGGDPTLEKAVEVLMDQLRKQKPSNVKKADFPKVKSGGGR